MLVDSDLLENNMSKFKNINFNNYEDYEDDLVSFKKMAPKAKKFKGHQSKHQDRRNDKWNTEDSLEETDDFSYTSFSETEAEEKRQKFLEQRKISDAQNTHEVRGIPINFNGVLKMEKINSVFKDKPSYGIKFYFKGKNNSFKHIWFNQRQRERDMVFQQELNFLESIQKKDNYEKK